MCSLCCSDGEVSNRITLAWEQMLFFWAVPIAGGLLAALVFYFGFLEEDNEEKVFSVNCVIYFATLSLTHCSAPPCTLRRKPVGTSTPLRNIAVMVSRRTSTTTMLRSNTRKWNSQRRAPKTRTSSQTNCLAMNCALYCPRPLSLLRNRAVLEYAATVSTSSHNDDTFLMPDRRCVARFIRQTSPTAMSILRVCARERHCCAALY